MSVKNDLFGVVDVIKEIKVYFLIGLCKVLSKLLINFFRVIVPLNIGVVDSLVIEKLLPIGSTVVFLCFLFFKVLLDHFEFILIG
jgi:hypothetical protein